jgi:pantoate--beta-alanine ligase
MIEVIREVAEFQHRLGDARNRGLSIGLVPTMGALHAGHLSLIERARRENEVVAVSIFVNPTQYDDPGDLERYPQPFDADAAACERAGVDLVLAPDFDNLYRDGYRFKVTEAVFSRELEGAHRDGHFDGVLTVVLKLLNIVRPQRAYFGEKDWQQLQLVRDMVDVFFLEAEIVACPTVREEDGLAMSSRNALLGENERLLAPRFHEVLESGLPVEEMAALLRKAGFDVDYVERRNNRILGAVRLGKVRLIDNVQV